MTYQAIRERSHSLRLIAERLGDLPTEELLDSLDETLDGLSGPQKRSTRILTDMAAWMDRIEKNAAVGA